MSYKETGRGIGIPDPPSGIPIRKSLNPKRNAEKGGGGMYPDPGSASEIEAALRGSRTFRYNAFSFLIVRELPRARFRTFIRKAARHGFLGSTGWKTSRP